MSWPELIDTALQEIITQRQSTALSTYELDHNLLIEHVRQEDSFRTGGYGTRQIPELLQNAVDALGTTGGTGTVEFRLADGALYCANEGSPFGEEGITAVTYAFLSSKRGDEIGRFGLGFKSVLGITDHPQIFSSSVSFGFNAPETAELFAGVASAGGRYPLLRVPSLLDAENERRNDRNLAELMTWATTVVKLPISREYERIREELEGFKAESLLFLKPLDRLLVSVQTSPAADPQTRSFTRAGHPDAGALTLTAPDGSETKWLYAERQYEPTIDVASTLPATSRRAAMTVSYAVNPSALTSTGRLWSWFPLLDETTAGGLFNAPWEVNDDRTSLVAGSALNKAMLGVAADLFLDVVTRTSSPEDPAAHLELFPGRGKEIRSNADRFLTNSIPHRAKSRPIIPDVTGELKVPSYFVRVPELEKITPQAAQIWQSHSPRQTMPHWRCFTSATRRSRLRNLLGGEDNERATNETTLAAWIEELASDRSAERTVAALEIVRTLESSDGAVRDAARSAPIVPLEGGGWARVDAASSVLIPAGDLAPEGVRLVEREFSIRADAHDLLRGFGFRAVSSDEVLSALANTATDRWGEDEWTRFWLLASDARIDVAERAVVTLRNRDVIVRVRTRDGSWSDIRRLLVSPSMFPGLMARHVDPEMIPDPRLNRAAGALERPVVDFPVWKEPIFAEYVKATLPQVREAINREGRWPATQGLPDQTGAGPLNLLTELTDDQDRIAWSRQLLEAMPSAQYMIEVPVIGSAQVAEIQIWSAERWALRRHGLFMTTLGPRTWQQMVGSRLDRFRSLLPVADPQVSLAAGLPSQLSDVPDPVLEEFLERDGFMAEDGPELGQLLVAAAEVFSAPSRIPAVVGSDVVLTPPEEVAVAKSDAEMTDLREAGVAFVQLEGDPDILVSEWGLIPADEAMQLSLESKGVQPDVPLSDLHPSLSQRVGVSIKRVRVARADELFRVTQSIKGTRRVRMAHAKHDGVVLVDNSFDAHETLFEISNALDLGLTREDVRAVIAADTELRRSDLIARAQTTPDDESRLLLLAGAEALADRLPRGLLPAVEARSGVLGDRGLAELFLQINGNDSVRVVRDDLRRGGIPVPDRWDGSPAAQQAVKNLGFETRFAGTREQKPAGVTQVPGKVVLNELHDFQEQVAVKIRELVCDTRREGGHGRGLLYLPTGAGKTRVTVEATLQLLKEGALDGPVLWIAQSQELCEQTIHTFSEVWRWMGDERPLDVSRFWSGYELDESNEELQIVVAIDDTLASRLAEPHYGWLTRASLVIIDEAHTAMSKNYTEILRVLGLTSARTDRPLLGLTATPFRGRNDEVNRLFASRFGNNRLESLDPEDPIGELREMKVLCEVDYRVLEGSSVSLAQQDPEFHRMKEVSKSMLDTIGQNLERTQTVVDDIKGLDPDWPVLVFAASVASAHTIAALLRLDGVEADAVDGSMRRQERRRYVERFKSGESRVLVNCDLLTQGFDAPKVRALYIARPTFSPNRYLQMVGRGLRGPENGGKERCLIVNVNDTFEQFGEELAYNEFDYLWSKA